MKRRLTRPIPLFLLFLLGGCASEKLPEHLLRVTAEVQVRPTLCERIRLRERVYVRAGSYLDLHYTFRPQPGFQPTEHPFRVMAHMVREDGTPLLIEDHLPPIPTTQWQAGKAVTYSDVIRIPEDITVARVALRVGLVDPVDPSTRHFMLNAEGEPDRKPTILRFFVQREESLEFVEGFYNLEFGEGGRRSWHWMGRSGRLRLRQPDRVGFLELGGGTRRDCFSAPPVLSWRLNEVEGAPFVLQEDRLDLVLPVSRACLEHDALLLELEMDRTFKPRDCGDSQDVRDLGLMVEQVRFSGSRFEDGWYAPEQGGGKTWRWMGAQARCQVGLPPGDGYLVLSARAPLDRLEKAPSIEILLDGRLLERFTPRSELIDRYFPLRREEIGNGETAEILLRTDRTFVPSSVGPGDDHRTLGLQVEYLDSVPLPKTTGQGIAD